MLKERDRTTAERFGILSLVEKLQADLLAVDGVADVEFDLSGFWSDIPQVIFLVKYEIPMDDYFQKRRKLLAGILGAAAGNGLARTGDSIEDYGQHFYIVTELKGEASK